MTDQPTQPTDQPDLQSGNGEPEDLAKTQTGETDDLADLDDRDLAKQVLIEPEDYTGQPVQNGPQDDLDDDEDYDEALGAPETPADRSGVPEGHSDPASGPAGS